MQRVYRQGTSRLVFAAMLVALCVPLVVQASPLWCSPFETDDGVAVTHEQAVSVIDNRVGVPGVAAGSVSTLTPPIYVPYDGSITLPNGATLLSPGTLDPAHAALNFGLSMPDERSVGINTGLRSNSGNFTTGLTFEGYFLTPMSDPANDATFIARRLVTQKRDSASASRLSIGLHASRVGVTDGLHEFDGLDYPTGSPVMAGLAGGIGWNGPWADGDGDFQAFSNDGVSLSSPAFPVPSVGSRISKTGAGEVARALSRTVDLSQEGNVLFVSFLIKKTPQATSSGEAVEVNFVSDVGSSTKLTRFGMTSDEKFFLQSSSVTTGTVVDGETYFIIAKVVSHDGNDDVSMNIYKPTDTVPAEEPAWTLSTSITGTNSGATIGAIRIETGPNVVAGEVDEIRVGSTYAAVTDPNAPLGNPGEAGNALAVFWGQATSPTTTVNHMRLGNTPVLPNQWYYFAVVHDGTNIKWYLNDVLQGDVPTPDIVPPGVAQIALANNRITGANDRGFYGILDEIRLWDRALTAAELMVNGGGPGAGLLWRSRFETDSGQPVSSTPPLTTADTFACIDNSIGAPDGTPAGIVTNFYVAYGQTGVPAIPSGPTDIDPGQLAGEFAVQMPDVPFVAINTNLPSDAGELENAVTVQGYFNTSRTVPVAITYAGSRLVTLMRTATEGSLRLAVGLGPNAEVPATGNVLCLVWADTNGTLTEVNGTTPIVAGTWYHFALVYDGTDVRFYLNGQQEGEALAPNLGLAGSANIMIGNDRSFAGQRGFYGLLDKIVVSDHVIAPAQFMPAALDPCLGKWCSQPFADFDGDTDVDIVDFAAFQRCFALTTLLEGNPCLCFDKDSDNVVTASDLTEFVKCFTGPGLVWSMGVTPDCNP